MDKNTTDNEEGKDSVKVSSNEGSSQVIKEGKAEVLLSSSKNVFYNPVQEFNRDLSIAVLTLCAEDHRQRIWEKKAKRNEKTQENGSMDIPSEELKPGTKYEEGLTILEALSASGLRSIRYAKEVPGVKEIVANDISEKAAASIRANVSHNGVDHLVTTSHDDAVMVMYRHRRSADRFNAIDLDPYGCPSPFLDAAVQSVSDGGVLLVTCTDMAVLAGNCPETCYSKYGAISLHIKSCHEMALRIVLQCLESHANRYGRYIVPLLSISADFYVRVFVRMFTSPAMCKRTTSKLAFVFQCKGCKTLTLQPLGVSHQYGDKPHQFKFTLPHGPPVGTTCEHCDHRHHIGGPIWSGPLHDDMFVSRLKELACRGEFGTARRMQGVLAVIQEELPDVPLYYTLDSLCSILHSETLPMMQFRSALLNAGYRVSFSHASRMSIKTDAPSNIVWDIMRHWIKQHPVRQERLVGAAAAILSREPTTQINMELHPDANPQSREKGLVRFQENPQRYWGPGMRAKSNTQGEDKMEKSRKNQGKRNRSESSSPAKDGSTKQLKSGEETLQLLAT
ncbi:tRNA (guanine(26)-N(2))-dimethyltransferase [Periplaneta americana]|uniref:tRNA (guanine(26)-N(2))-dimethyltransferase n=1 Tax=Periplaneta americana TaxID=6978 RepID=UPI0037E75F40